MASAAAAFIDVNSFDGRVFSRGDLCRATRAIGRHTIMGLAAVATVGLLVIGITVVAAWIVNATVATNPQIHAKALTGPGRLALVDRTPSLTGFADTSFETKWTRATASTMPLTLPRPLEVPQTREKTLIAKVPLPRPYPGERQVARLPDATVAPQVVARTEIQVESKPAPQAAPQIERAIERQAAPQVTPKAPPQVAAVAPPPAQNKSLMLPDPGSRTAIYDISARTVYMPNGEKLEAHSGLGDKMDDPRHTRIRMRGPTPPNVYELALRERLFHGVKAIRLNPVDEGKMFGRDGMLAHSYLLGPNGQSHGCVSFKNYQAFLDAYLNGEIDRLVVVPDRSDTSWRTVVAQLGPPKREVRREPVRREPVRRYASAYSMPAEPSPLTW